jgi:outer membrane protein OmpA-like peptidoglycan-associated protein/tetratricopeptide (TPR) repeat protein
MKINVWKKDRLLYSLLSLLILLWVIPGYAQDDEDEKTETGCVTVKQISKSSQKTFEKAKKLYQKGNSSEAMPLLMEVAEEEPTFAEPFFIMGKINLNKLEKLDSQIPGKGRDNSESLRNQLIKKAEQNFSSAINACKEVDPICYFNLGKLLYIQDRFKEAVPPLEFFIKNADGDKYKDQIEVAKNDIEDNKFLDKVLNNPVPFNLKRVEGVSSPNPEYLFCVSPDDEICFYTRVLMPAETQSGMSYTPKPKEYFYYSERDTVNKRFDNGNPMPDPFNKGGNEGSPTITVDNKYMVFAKVENVEGYENSDLYFSEFKNDDWTPITNLGFNINSPRTWESQPSISADGKTLFFVSDRDNNNGPDEDINLDIFVSYRKPDGSWGKAQSVGNVINSPGQEKTPFIHSDSQTLYFSSNGHTGIGGMDIFFSKMEDNGRWSKPKNIGIPINTGSDEVGFFVSLDGTKGYYTSAMSGNFDLYEFELYPEARPQRVALIKGEIKSEDGEPIVAKVELKNTETKNVVEIAVDQNTGKYATVASLKNDYVLTVKKEGYAYETKFIDSKDLSAPAKQKVDFAISPIEEGKSYKLNDIYFATNSFELTRESRLVTDAFVEFLTENPSVVVEIQGHTDNVGNDNDNMVLSDNRAKSVYDYIISTGVNADRLKYKGYGKTKPIASNDTEEGRSKNRRTVFVILKK